MVNCMLRRVIGLSDFSFRLFVRRVSRDGAVLILVYCLLVCNLLFILYMFCVNFFVFF